MKAVVKKICVNYYELIYFYLTPYMIFLIIYASHAKMQFKVKICTCTVMREEYQDSLNGFSSYINDDTVLYLDGREYQG